MKSNLHLECNQSCAGHPAHPQRQAWIRPTPRDWEEVGFELAERYASNQRALELIPPQYRPGEPEEEESSSSSSSSEEEEDKATQAPTSRRQSDEDQSSKESDDEEVSMFVEVGRQLVDRSVSPIPLSGPASTPRINKPRRPSGVLFDTPWIQPSHFDGTSFYTDSISVVMVERTILHTTMTNAFDLDAWMCGSIPVEDRWQQYFLANAPQLAFKRGKEFCLWEWVSHQPFIPNQNVDSDPTMT